MTKLIDRDDAVFKEIKEIYTESFSGDELAPELALRYAFDTGVLFVRHADGLKWAPIIAFAILTQDRGEPFIWTIATAPKARQQGFAGALIREIIWYSQSHNRDVVELTVKVDNPAQKLYFDLGFRVVKFLPKHYGEIAGLRMRRKLR